METVSAKWNENQKQRIITAPTLLDVTIEVTDPEAQNSAVTSANGETAFSDAAALTDGGEKAEDRYVTLERNFWALDGSFGILPESDTYPDNGYIGSALCGDDGTFTSPPCITISFPKVFTTYLEGLCVVWGAAHEGEIADTFTITAYNGETVVTQKTISGNTEMTSVVLMAITNYDSIKLTIEKWALGNHRARIQSIMLGIKHTYDKSDISEYTHKTSSDLLANELPDIEISFKVKNLDFLYDPDNDSGMSKFLMARQAVKVRYGYTLDGSVEKIQGALVYLDEWESPRDGIHASFTARSQLVFMSEKYAGTESGTFYEIALAALTQAGLPTQTDGTVLWVLDESLKTMTAPADIELHDQTIGEVLQLIANAACCGMWQDRAGILHIAPREIGSAGYAITTNNEYSYPETALDKPLKAVNINDDMYVLDVAATGVVQSVNNPLIGTDRAPTVAAWIRDVLTHRQRLSGSWRVDPKIDALDVVTVDTPFHTNKTVLTSVELTFNGAWRGTYEGRVFEGSST